jgi:hypothetical protein
MITTTKMAKKNPLSKAQNKLLKDSLRKLLGMGLIEEQAPKGTDVKSIVIRNALKAIVLE